MPTTFPTGFMVLHSNQLESLRELMVAHLKAHPLPGLSPELILVQSNGMKHWLELGLAADTALGICAATQIELPATALWRLYRQVLGPDQVPLHMPLDKEPLTWRLMRLLPECKGRPEFAPLQRYLAGDTDGRKCHQLAAQLADVFDGYQNYRADWLADWAQGQARLQRPWAPAQALPEAQGWQAALWREVLADLDKTGHEGLPSRAAVHSAFMAKSAALSSASLPRRLVVFGVSSLPMQSIEALAALGQVCQVLMFVLNPCRYHWGNVVEGRQQLAFLGRRRQPEKAGLLSPQAHYSARDIEQLHLQAHPLLASWGQQVRDYLHLLDTHDDVERYRAHLLGRVDAFVDPAQQAQDEGRPVTQLMQLQSAILNLEPLPAKPLQRDPQDDSLVFVQAHSAVREIEVLHDQLLQWLGAASSELTPQDIMVMVPDMAVFAPLIHAVFGRFAKDDPRHLPYSVADSTPLAHPVMQAIEHLLQLPSLRLTLGDWLSLLEVEAVQSAFELAPADVDVLQDWLHSACVRWGLDAQHRLQWGMPAGMAQGEQNTWSQGLRRLLLNYAMGRQTTASTTWQGVHGVPDAHVGGLEARLLGSLSEWLAAMEDSLQMLSVPHTPADWLGVLQRLLQRFFKPTHDSDARWLQRALEPLEQWVQHCETAALTDALPLMVVREQWLAHLEAPGLQQRFLGGGVQFATLMPMRSIPFKVVCLLGMNDGDYPRSQAVRDFDLMRLPEQRRAGDRSRREDDRYLFLEALLSARARLYISWQGWRSTDHAEQPPSVLVAQLRDHLARGWNQAPPVRTPPLQAFSARYFSSSDSEWVTHASEWEPAKLPAPSHAAPQVSSPLALSLQDLQQLLRQPLNVYYRHRLQLRMLQPEVAPDEHEPFELNRLQNFQLTLSLVAQGRTDDVRFLQGQGLLPLAGFAAAPLKRLQKQADELLKRSDARLQADASWQALPAQSVTLDLPNLGKLEGTLAGTGWYVNDQGSVLHLDLRPGAVSLEGGAPKLNTLIHLWVTHLAACAQGLAVTSTMLGLDHEWQFAPLPAEFAQTELAHLVRCYHQAWQAPMCLPGKTAATWWAVYQHRLSSPKAKAVDVPAEALAAAHKAARAVFESASFSEVTGEREAHAMLRRHFADYEAAAAQMPALSEALYGPMYKAARKPGGST